MYEIVAFICLQNLNGFCKELVLLSGIDGQVTCEHKLEKDVKPSHYIVICRPTGSKTT